MSILKVTYEELSFARKDIRKTASELDNYASKMERGVARKIGSISGGQSTRTEAALSETWAKIKQLKDKSNKLNSYASKVEKFENNVKATDQQMAKKIEASSISFAKDHGFKVGKVSAFFKSLAINVFNSSSLARWAKDVYNKVENKANEWKTEINHWFRTGGGKYVKDIALSVLAIGVAVFTILTVGTGILAVLAVIGGVIALFNAANNIITSAVALSYNNDDPAWAHRYGKLDKASDTLRFFGYEKFAAVLDITEDVTTIVASVTTIGSLGRKLTDFLGNKGFLSIKQLFGNGSNETVGILGDKFMLKVDEKFKFTPKRFYSGLKSVFTESSFRKSIGSSCRLFKDELVDMFKYTKMNMKQSGYVFKNLVKGDTAQKLRSKEILRNFVKTDIKNTLKSGWGKIKKEAIPDFSKINEKINNANMLGIKFKFNSKGGKVFKNVIIQLNKTDKVYKSGESIYKGTILIPNIDNFKSKIQKIYKSVIDIPTKGDILGSWLIKQFS